MPYNFLRRFVTRVTFALAVFLPGFAFAQTLLSQNMPAVQSSQEAALAASAAVDGNTTTRWGSAFTDNEWIYVDLGKAASITRVVLNWEAAYGKSYQIQVSNDAATWTSIYTTAAGDGGIDDLAITGTGRYVRMLGVTRGTPYGYSLYEFQVFGTFVQTPVLVSPGKSLTASSQETSATEDFSPSKAADGNLTTRWSSAFTNTEWIYVDLGSSYNISRVVLNWEAAYGKAYQIQVSDDASTWTNIYSTTTADGGVDDLTVSGAGRYVRMYGTNRGTVYGYSLYEFQVYGVPKTNSSSSFNSASSSSGVSSSTGGTTCNTLPATPTGLNASGITSTGLVLAWTAVNGGTNCPITGYRVYRNGTQISTVTGTNTTASGLTASTSYGFTVAATNAFGASPQSTTLTVTTNANPAAPNFGSNVVIFDTSMSAATIQSKINSIYAIQQNNQFGSERNAIMFKPGTYNVDIPVGFYTQIIGLGAMPDDVNITKQVHSDPYLDNNNATCNFWRGVENFSVTPGASMKWAVSQANPFRRMHVRNTGLLLHANGGWASGGWISDSIIDGTVESGSQQQWFSRNTQWGGWSGSSWNMVFVGIPNNLPSGTWPSKAYTFVNNTPIVREKPFLYLNGDNYEVFVPALRTNSTGISWGAGQSAGTSISLEQFYVARAGVDNASTLNAALNQGKNLLFTPGVYDLNDSLYVNRAETIILGMGFATLRPTTGKTVLAIADVDGVKVAHLIVDAGTTNSPVLIQVGPTNSTASHTSNPTSLSDVFVRIGGATDGKATVSMQVNSDDVVIDHIWMWRADHGAGASWYDNMAQNGLVVNGDRVTAYGLFVEHYQQYQVLWNGNGGRSYFYQSELPYDPPNQGAWMAPSGSVGWASYKVADSVTTHEAWGLGIYAVFYTPNVYLSQAIQVPNTSGVKLHHMVTTNFIQNGGINNVINNTGGFSSGGPRVTDYP